MVEHVLVAVDGSEQAWNALEYALEEFPNAEFTALHVINPIEATGAGEAGITGYADEWYEAAKDQSEAMLEEASERAAERGADLATTTEVGRPSRSIVEYAEEHDVDGIVMGSRGRTGLSRILLGSVAETVVRRSPVPVTVVR